MDEENTELRTRVLLSLQRALVGMVTLNMQAVFVSWSSISIHARVLFNKPISPSDFELTSLIETEVIADFPTYNVRCIAESCVINERLMPLSNEVPVFKRALQDNYSP